jgi:hypothetical protein
MRRRRRDAEAVCGLPDRAASLDREHERVPTSESKLGITVKLHLALL